jgi:hypothetical protein
VVPVIVVGAIGVVFLIAYGLVGSACGGGFLHMGGGHSGDGYHIDSIPGDDHAPGSGLSGLRPETNAQAFESTTVGQLQRAWSEGQWPIGQYWSISHCVGAGRFLP